MTEFQLAVAFHELLAFNQRWQVRAVRHVKENGQGSNQEGKQIEHPHTQDAKEKGKRDEAEQDEASRIGQDEDRALAQSVHPHPGNQPKQQGWDGSQGREYAHLKRCSPEDQHGCQRKSQK